MSLRTILLGSGSRFGHFAAPPAPAPAASTAPAADDEAAAKKAEDEEAKKAAEEEEEARRARRARKAKKAKGRKSDGEDPDDDDPDGDDAADDKDTDDDDADLKKAAAAGHGFALEAAFRSGARAQRRRCATILACPEAAANPVMAMKLAFETPMTASAAVDVLKTTPAAGRSGGLAARMAGSVASGVRLPPSSPSAPTGPAATAASWDAALKDFGAAR